MRWFWLLAVCFALLGTLPGCGGNDTSGTSDQPPQTQPEQEEAPPPQQPPP